MKSFSSTSYAGEHTEALAAAAKAVGRNPQALFTAFQWYLYKVRNTVYFTAASKTAFDKESLGNFVAGMVALAPQLTHGFVGAKPGQPFPKHILDAITSVEEVDSFEGYPDIWLEPGLEIFEQKDLPLFRVKAVTLRGGPDAQGRASMVLVRSSHALLEGSDSALLTRSLSAAHGTVAPKKEKVPFKVKFKMASIGTLIAGLSLYMANTKPVAKKDIGFKSLAIERGRLKALAARLGVRQRSLMFGLVTQCLNVPEKNGEKQVVTAAYTMLDDKRNDTDDDFFRVKTLDGHFQIRDNFIDYVRGIDDSVAESEAKDVTKRQIVINAMFKAHRRINRVLPFLYNDRFATFSRGVIDVVLTLVPPHRVYGDMTNGLMEPIYIGSYHPSTNLCTFCPGRDFVTFNFAMEQRHLANVPKIMTLLEETERSEIAPRVKAAPAIEAAE